MIASTVLDKVILVVREVFDEDKLAETQDVMSLRLDAWDSLSNIRLFLGIEKEFSLRFSTAEIVSVKTIGEFAKLIEAKLGENN